MIFVDTFSRLKLSAYDECQFLLVLAGWAIFFFPTTAAVAVIKSAVEALH